MKEWRWKIAVHEISDAKGSFIPVNCAAIPGELIESELFGHTGGAFTGPKQVRDGLFEAADGGTLFLDEIGELPRGVQPKLLPALQDGSVRRVRQIVSARLLYERSRRRTAI